MIYINEMNYNEDMDNNNNEEEINDLNDINEDNYLDNNDYNNNFNNQRPIQMNPETSNLINEYKRANEKTRKLINNPIQNKNIDIPLNYNNMNMNINLNNDDISDTNNYNYMKYNNNINIPKKPLMNFDNISLLKIQNQVLAKSNLDLKNYNKCLKAELNSYKKMTLGNFNYNNNSPFNQNEHNLNAYIQTLKTSLNSSQMSNLELQDLLKNVQEQKKILEQQYENLNQNIEECNLIMQSVRN